MKAKKKSAPKRVTIAIGDDGTIKLFFRHTRKKSGRLTKQSRLRIIKVERNLRRRFPSARVRAYGYGACVTGIGPAERTITTLKRIAWLPCFSGSRITIATAPATTVARRR